MYNAELVLQERHGIAYALINSKLCSLCSDRMDTMHSPKYRRSVSFVEAYVASLTSWPSDISLSRFGYITIARGPVFDPRLRPLLLLF